MWYHSTMFTVGMRDVIGAWLVCLAVATAFFGWTALAASGDTGAVYQDPAIHAAITPSTTIGGTHKCG